MECPQYLDPFKNSSLESKHDSNIFLKSSSHSMDLDLGGTYLETATTRSLNAPIPNGQQHGLNIVDCKSDSGRASPVASNEAHYLDPKAIPSCDVMQQEEPEKYSIPNHAKIAFSVDGDDAVNLLEQENIVVSNMYCNQVYGMNLCREGPSPNQESLTVATNNHPRNCLGDQDRSEVELNSEKAIQGEVLGENMTETSSSFSEAYVENDDELHLQRYQLMDSTVSMPNTIILKSLPFGESMIRSNDFPASFKQCNEIEPRRFERESVSEHPKCMNEVQSSDLDDGDCLAQHCTSDVLLHSDQYAVKNASVSEHSVVKKVASNVDSDETLSEDVEAILRKYGQQFMLSAQSCHPVTTRMQDLSADEQHADVATLCNGKQSDNDTYFPDAESVSRNMLHSDTKSESSDDFLTNKIRYLLSSLDRKLDGEDIVYDVNSRQPSSDGQCSSLDFKILQRDIDDLQIDLINMRNISGSQRGKFSAQDQFALISASAGARQDSSSSNNVNNSGRMEEAGGIDETDDQNHQTFADKFSTPRIRKFESASELVAEPSSRIVEPCITEAVDCISPKIKERIVDKLHASKAAPSLRSLTPEQHQIINNNPLIMNLYLMQGHMAQDVNGGFMADDQLKRSCEKLTETSPATEENFDSDRVHVSTVLEPDFESSLNVELTLTSDQLLRSNVLPYRPPGASEVYYVDSDDASLSGHRSETTVESTHPGSDDAKGPLFPLHILGSRVTVPMDLLCGVNEVSASKILQPTTSSALREPKHSADDNALFEKYRYLIDVGEMERDSEMQIGFSSSILMMKPSKILDQMQISFHPGLMVSNCEVAQCMNSPDESTIMPDHKYQALAVSHYGCEPLLARNDSTPVTAFNLNDKRGPANQMAALVQDACVEPKYDGSSTYVNGICMPIDLQADSFAHILRDSKDGKLDQHRVPSDIRSKELISLSRHANELGQKIVDRYKQFLSGDQMSCDDRAGKYLEGSRKSHRLTCGEIEHNNCQKQVPNDTSTGKGKGCEHVGKEQSNERERHFAAGTRTGMFADAAGNTRLRNWKDQSSSDSDKPHVNYKFLPADLLVESTRLEKRCQERLNKSHNVTQDVDDSLQPKHTEMPLGESLTQEQEDPILILDTGTGTLYLQAVSSSSVDESDDELTASGPLDDLKLLRMQKNVACQTEMFLRVRALKQQGRVAVHLCADVHKGSSSMALPVDSTSASSAGDSTICGCCMEANHRNKCSRSTGIASKYMPIHNVGQRSNIVVHSVAANEPSDAKCNAVKSGTGFSHGTGRHEALQSKFCYSVDNRKCEEIVQRNRLARKRSRGIQTISSREFENVYRTRHGRGCCVDDCAAAEHLWGKTKDQEVVSKKKHRKKSLCHHTKPLSPPVAWFIPFHCARYKPKDSFSVLQVIDESNSVQTMDELGRGQSLVDSEKNDRSEIKVDSVLADRQDLAGSTKIHSLQGAFANHMQEFLSRSQLRLRRIAIHKAERRSQEFYSAERTELQAGVKFGSPSLQANLIDADLWKPKQRWVLNKQETKALMTKHKLIGPYACAAEQKRKMNTIKNNRIRKYMYSQNVLQCLLKKKNSTAAMTKKSI